MSRAARVIVTLLLAAILVAFTRTEYAPITLTVHNHRPYAVDILIAGDSLVCIGRAPALADKTWSVVASDFPPFEVVRFIGRGDSTAFVSATIVAIPGSSWWFHVGTPPREIEPRVIVGAQ